MRKSLSLGVFLLVLLLVLAGCAEGTTVPSKVDTDQPQGSTSSNQTDSVGLEDVTEEEVQEEQVEEVTARVGETLDYGGLQLTLESVEKYVDTSEFFMDTPPEGHEFILLWFVANNTTSEDYYVNMFYEDSYLDGFSVDPEVMLINVQGETLWGDVAAGKKRRGYVGYAVPTGSWEELEFQYKPDLFGGQASKMRFIISSSDI